MLRFAYLPVPLGGTPPPSLSPGATVRWRSLVPVRVLGPSGGSRVFPRAVLDTGADDTVFPIDLATRLGVTLRADTGHRVIWRGQAHPLRFADIELELADTTGSAFRWPATVAFSPAPIRFPILGHAGCLCFFDATFRGHDRVVELEANRAYPGGPP